MGEPQHIGSLIQKILERLEDVHGIVLENGKPFLDLEHACEYLNISRHHLYKLTSKKLIPFFQRARKIYFKVDDLDQWVLDYNHRVKSTNELDQEAATYTMLNGK